MHGDGCPAPSAGLTVSKQQKNCRLQKQNERCVVKNKDAGAMSKPIFHWILRRSLALACAAGLPTLAAQAQGPTPHAKAASPSGAHQQFPPDHPAFRFDLPANWTVDRGNTEKSMLICNVVGHGDIGLLCMGVPNIFSQDDFARILPGLAQDKLERQ